MEQVVRQFGQGFAEELLVNLLNRGVLVREAHAGVRVDFIQRFASALGKLLAVLNRLSAAACAAAAILASTPNCSPQRSPR